MNMNKHISHAMQYIVWFLKEYNMVKNSNEKIFAYKLVEVKQKSEYETELLIQISGTASTFKASPKEVLADDSLTEKFSSKDIRTITYYACNPSKKTTTNIKSKRFCFKLNQLLFGVESNHQVLEKTANDISLDNELIKKLSPEDAHMIGLICGQEQQLNVEQQIRRYNETTSFPNGVK